MENCDVFEKDRRYVAHTYNRFPAAIKNGHGAQAEDFEGKRYIDFGSGIGTNALGQMHWDFATINGFRLLFLR